MKRHTVSQADEDLRFKRPRFHAPATLPSLPPSSLSSSSLPSIPLLVDPFGLPHSSGLQYQPIAPQRLRPIRPAIMSSSAAEAHSQRPPSPSASSTLSSSRTPWPTGHYNNPIFIDDGCVEPPGSSASHNTQPAAVPVPSTTSYSGVPSNAVTKASSDNNIQAQSNQFSHPPAAAAVAVAASSQSTKSVPAPPRRPFPVGCPSDTASSSANTPTDFGSRSPQYVNSPRARSTLSTSTSASSTNMEIPRHAHHHHQRQQQQPVPSVALPTWQPDSEVTKCPICDVQFTFFYRKHHCRRCGRVVCASCSPHRLPIPRQYIVEQPLATDPYSPASRHDAGHLTEARTGSFSYPSDGWLAPLEGERDVRLCNQCAPNLQNNTGGQGSPANANSRSQFPAWYSQYSNRPRVSSCASTSAHLGKIVL